MTVTATASRLSFAVIGVLALAGCGASAADGSSAAVDASPACSIGGSASSTAGGRQLLRSQGEGWTYVQTLPDAYDGSTPGPLVLSFGAEAPDHFDDGAVVVHVDGPVDTTGWTGDEDQVQLVRDLLQRAEVTQCFDQADVSVQGSADAQPQIQRLDLSQLDTYAARTTYTSTGWATSDRPATTETDAR